MRAFLAIPAVFVTSVALAANGTGAHFMSTSGSVNTNGQLVVSFSEAGLGQQNIQMNLSANAKATWACINGGDKHPQASNKATADTTVATNATFPVKNGRVTDVITAGPPDIPSGFSCPNGQTLVFACVSYTNISLTDVTNNVDADIPDQSVSFTSIRGVSCA